MIHLSITPPIGWGYWAPYQYEYDAKKTIIFSIVIFLSGRRHNLTTHTVSNLVASQLPPNTPLYLWWHRGTCFRDFPTLSFVVTTHCWQRAKCKNTQNTIFLWLLLYIPYFYHYYLFLEPGATISKCLNNAWLRLHYCKNVYAFKMSRIELII